MITVLTAATSNALVERATVKTLLNLGPSDSSRDEAIDKLIPWVSDTIEGHLGRPLARQKYQEFLAGNGDVFLNLANWPVETGDSSPVTVSVGGVPICYVSPDAILTSDVQTWTWDDPDEGLLYMQEGFHSGALQRGSLGYRRQAGTDLPNVAVTYTAGYVLPGDSRATNRNGGPYALPGEIERAAAIQVKDWLLKDRRDDAIASRAVSSGSRRSDVTTDPYLQANITYTRDTSRPGILCADALTLLRRFKDQAF